MLVAIADVDVGPRLRALREDVVLSLMASIEAIGLQTPISVSTGIAKREGTADDISIVLRAGHHRLEACRRLGWTEIEARVVQMSEDECELWEIDENLCRADLTELERGEHLAKRKALYERLHPEAKAGAVRAAGMNRALGHNVADNLSTTSFAADTANKIGIDARTVRRTIHRVEQIDSKVRDRIRDVPEIADSGVELDALAAMEPSQQRRAVAMVESGQAAGIRDARKLMEPKTTRVTATEANASDRWRSGFIAYWTKGTDADREWAREYIDEPIADNTSLRVVK